MCGNELRKEILKFRNTRDWGQYHNPKDLAISISLEAAELLENFQWKNNKEAIKKNNKKIEKEISDIYIYLNLLVDELDINLEKAVKEKLKENAKKYPIDKCKGSKQKYTELKEGE